MCQCSTCLRDIGSVNSVLPFVFGFVHRAKYEINFRRIDFILWTDHLILDHAENLFEFNSSFQRNQNILIPDKRIISLITRNAILC